MTTARHLTALRAGRRTTTAIVAVVLLAASAGAASAYWLTAGSGAGAAPAGDLQALTTQALVQPAAGQQSLAPGGTADAVIRVANPNAYPVQLYSVAASGPAAADAGHPQCVTTGVSFQNPGAPLTPTVTIPANSSQTVSLPGTVSMDLSSDTGCQGALFSLPLTLEVRK